MGAALKANPPELSGKPGELVIESFTVDNEPQPGCTDYYATMIYSRGESKHLNADGSGLTASVATLMLLANAAILDSEIRHAQDNDAKNRLLEAMND